MRASRSGECLGVHEIVIRTPQRSPKARWRLDFFFFVFFLRLLFFSLARFFPPSVWLLFAHPITPPDFHLSNPLHRPRRLPAGRLEDGASTGRKRRGWKRERTGTWRRRKGKRRLRRRRGRSFFFSVLLLHRCRVAAARSSLLPFRLPRPLVFPVLTPLPLSPPPRHT